MNKVIDKLNKTATSWMNIYGIMILRIALGIVFLWFGVLKLIGQSPVVDLIGDTYSFMPKESFMIILGIWEAIIGLGLLSGKFIKTTLILLWLQMAGTFGSLILSPKLFFNDNIFLLTTYGEFVLKNLVLVAASIVIGGHHETIKK